MNYCPLVISLKDTYLQSLEKKILQHSLVGGVFLFSENFACKEQLTKLISEINQICQKTDKKILIMTDHEGGFVQPFTFGFSSIPAARRLGSIYDIDPTCALTFAESIGELTASELKSCGVDIVLGPVLDLDKGNSVISGLDRAFHSDPIIVTHLAEAYIKGLANKGMSATLKHFPGHGLNVGDSHVMQPRDDRAFQEIMENDLIPFQALIKNTNVGAIMPAHILYPKIDNKNIVTHSTIWLKDILRNQLGFNGVIISDSLSMEGAGKDDLTIKIEKALEFGDIALLCDKTPEDYISLLESLEPQHFKLSGESIRRIERWLNG